MLSVHGDCHLAQTEEKTPIRVWEKKKTRNKKKREKHTAGALCVPGDEATSSCLSLSFFLSLSLPLSLSLSLLVPVRMGGEKCRLVFCMSCCCWKEGRKVRRKEGRDRPADFPRPIPWFSRTSSLPWCCFASYVAGRGNLVHSSAEGRPAELHTLALTAPVQTGAREKRLPGGGGREGGGGGGGSAHARARTHTQEKIPTRPPDVTPASKPHWPFPSWVYNVQRSHVRTMLVWLPLLLSPLPPFLLTPSRNLNASQAGKLGGGGGGGGGGDGGGGEREYSYCTCCVTNVFPPANVIQGKAARGDPSFLCRLVLTMARSIQPCICDVHLLKQTLHAAVVLEKDAHKDCFHWRSFCWCCSRLINEWFGLKNVLPKSLIWCPSEIQFIYYLTQAVVDSGCLRYRGKTF